MASLKEVKNRINSVTSTMKITSAMKLVASSKLHKAQAAIGSMLPYERQLSAIMSRFVGGMQGEISSPYTEARPVSKAVVVAISSNSSLCGAFNSNVVKEMSRVVAELKATGTEVEVLTIGTKVSEKARRMSLAGTDESHAALLDHPAYSEAAQLAAKLMERYVKKEIDRVLLVYHHYKNTAGQELQSETFLPVDFSSVEEQETMGRHLDYIIEPSQEAIVEQLIPRVLHLKIYTALLDSLASEHAARVIAMQVATDNADELLGELTLMYNKTRQAAITAELLDIVGASFQ